MRKFIVAVLELTSLVVATLDFMPSIYEIRAGGTLYIVPKLCIRDPTTRFQPSTNTKKMSLNGNDIIIGGIINIPIDSRIDATTISIIRKGIKSRNPISKALLSSEIIKAGISTRIGVCPGVFTF